MAKPKILAALFITLVGSAYGGTVTTSASAPTVDLISSSATGGTDTALFDEDANANHARGQLFSLPDGLESAFEITTITVKKSNDQTYLNDTLTLRIFEGTEGQWNAGTGHSTEIDGSDYLVGSEVNLLSTETFDLSGAITNNHYVSFQLETPIVVNENSEFGFFMTYDQGNGTEDRFRHREATSGGGRTSITPAGHSTSSSRKLVYFVQGTPTTQSGRVIISATAPTTDILSSNNTGSTFSRLFDEDQNDNHARGQLFTLPNGAGTEYQLTSVTVQKNEDQTFDNDAITLRLFEGSQLQWDTGSGHSTATNGSDYYVGTSVSPLHTEAFNLDGLISNGDFVTFQFASPITVNEGSDFGFLLTYDESTDQSPDYFQHNEGAAGGRISITTTNHGTSIDRHMRYLLQGTASGDGGVLELGSPFQNRMVLQRDKPVSVWGIADPSTAVSVSINGNMVAGTSDANGDWKVELPAMSAGGPYELAVTSGLEATTIEDVLVGDVWFCFGQSNMVYRLNQMQSWADSYESAIAANDNIRCLKIDQDASLSEEDSCGMTWLSNSASDTWTAVGSVFAVQLQEATNVPVAIVWAAWGSSSIEGWMPLELAEQFPHFSEMLELYQSVSEYRNGDETSGRLPAGYSTNEEAIAGLSANGWSSNSDDIFMRTRPNTIYNKMVHPMRNFGISGFIWYQGEANTGAPDYSQYGFTLPKFVTEYRERFGQGDLPFLGVQLPSYNGTYWHWFRESQDQLRTLNNAHVAVTIDTGIANNIHPADTSKEKTGERLALLARRYALGESVEADGPRFDSMAVSGSNVTITFANGTGLNRNVSAGLFQIAGPGASPTFYAADSISVSRNTVTISSPSVTDPREVRYAWIPVPNSMTTLENSSRIPATPFRTDSFDLPGLGAQAPQAVDDFYEVLRDQSLVVPALGVLANDIDLNHDPLSSALVTDVSFGSLSLLADGSFTYIPDEGYAGPDSFTYRCNDGGLDSEEATVSIDIAGTSSNYYQWRSDINWGVEDDETTTGDPDFDGTVNFLEFALGLDPLVSDTSGLPTISLSGDGVLYDFNNVQPGVIYEVLTSQDLFTWGHPPFAVLSHESATPVPIPSSEGVDGRLFIRLRVSEP